MFNTLDGSQQLFTLYANPYNKGIKSLDAKQYEKALAELGGADNE